MTIIFRPLTLALLLLTFLLAGLSGGPQASFDIASSDSMTLVRYMHPQLTSVVAILTQLGSVYATLGLGLLVSAILAVRGKRHAAFLLATTVVVERLSVDGLKILVGRPRPDLDLPLMPSSLSFPSGHSANSMAAFAAIALIAMPPRWRRPAFAVALSLSIVIGMTRIFLGVHWPSDVVGGWAWGLLAVGLALAAGRRSGAIEAEHNIIGGHRPAVDKD